MTTTTLGVRASATGGGRARGERRDARARESATGTPRATRASGRRDALGKVLIGGVALAMGDASARARASEEENAIRVAYDGYASTYDDLDGGAPARALGLDDLRARALGSASGDVLELAVGTGLNLPAYDLKRVTSFTAIDLSPGMLAKAKARSETLAFGNDARFIEADATALPFEDGSFDFVVDTFSLCVIEDPVAALREVRRVLRPNGRAVLIEHSKSDVRPLGAYQDLTSKPVKTMSKGCVWNQDVEALIAQSGMRVVKTQRALLGLLVVVEASPSL